MALFDFQKPVADQMVRAVQQVGNAAKIREALDKLVNFLRWEYAQDYPVSRDKLADAIDIGVSALSSPLRNCDVLEEFTADDEFEKAMGFPPSKTADERDAIMRENWFLFKCWLFAEVKGETK